MIQGCTVLGHCETRNMPPMGLAVALPSRGHGGQPLSARHDGQQWTIDNDQQRHPSLLPRLQRQHHSQPGSLWFSPHPLVGQVLGLGPPQAQCCNPHPLTPQVPDLELPQAQGYSPRPLTPQLPALISLCLQSPPVTRPIEGALLHRALTMCFPHATPSR
jgi:hypothetical protein